MRLNKALKSKFILIFFASVFLARPSDTVTCLPAPTPSIQFTSYLIGVKITQMVFGLILLLYPIASKFGSKMPCILLFEIEFCSSSFLKILLFYPVLPTLRFKQLLFGGSYNKNPKNLKTYVFGRLFFDIQNSRSCHYSPMNYSTETYQLPIRHFFKFHNSPSTKLVSAYSASSFMFYLPYVVLILLHTLVFYLLYV